MLAQYRKRVTAKGHIIARDKHGMESDRWAIPGLTLTNVERKILCCTLKRAKEWPDSCRLGLQ